MSNEPQTELELIKEIVGKLKKAGIEKIEIDFSGSGDSGEVTDIRLYTNKRAYTAVEIQEDKTMLYNILKANCDSIQEIMDQLGNLATQCLIEGDWYNNDGGQGTIKINTKTGKVVTEVGYNEMIADERVEEYEL